MSDWIILGGSRDNYSAVFLENFFHVRFTPVVACATATCASVCFHGSVLLRIIDAGVDAVWELSVEVANNARKCEKWEDLRKKEVGKIEASQDRIMHSCSADKIGLTHGCYCPKDVDGGMAGHLIGCGGDINTPKP